MDRLISEQKAIEAINDYWGEMETPTIDGYINAIKAIPSAEPKTGHWIMTLCTATTNNGIALEGVACSGCNKITFMTNKTPLRCPWCDMDMRGDDNESGD